MTLPPGPLPLTVAIPTYNRANFLRQTLAGLALQVFPRGPFEVLVIDNNSTDHTRAVVAEFAHAHPAPRYLLETKQGLDHGRNRAIAAHLGFPVREVPMVLEAGSIAVDGAGLLVTTERCLLNPNRNPDLSRTDIEDVLRVQLGGDRIVWRADAIAVRRTPARL